MGGEEQTGGGRGRIHSLDETNKYSSKEFIFFFYNKWEHKNILTPYSKTLTAHNIYIYEGNNECGH